jgi:hypothetical protein
VDENKRKKVEDYMSEITCKSPGASNSLQKISLAGQ